MRYRIWTGPRLCPKFLGDEDDWICSRFLWRSSITSFLYLVTPFFGGWDSALCCMLSVVPCGCFAHNSSFKPCRFRCLKLIQDDRLWSIANVLSNPISSSPRSGRYFFPVCPVSLPPSNRLTFDPTYIYPITSTFRPFSFFSVSLLDIE